MKLRVGSGFDVHAFTAGEYVTLGGIRLPHTHGVLAHSDGDVLLHALCDALLGAAGLGDIGQHFPDSDPRWKGVESSQFVEAVRELIAGLGYQTQNVDLTLVCEAPRIGPHRDEICRRIAALLRISDDVVNLKATTTETLGFAGRREGIAAFATVLLLAQ
jgi:2-C-methyl-D-erythritol 2,4-cyclodiphosphate synthase